MVYSTQNGQLCSICQDLPFVGNITKSTTSEEIVVTVGKVLSACGHAFHSECIDRAIYSGSKDCPNCRAAIDIKDRTFEWMKDPVQPAILERHISINNGIHRTFISAHGIPEDEKNYLMNNMENIFNGKHVPGIVEKNRESFSIRLENII